MTYLYLIDVSGFIFRAFHALPPLQTPDGTPVGAVYGFCQMILRLLEDHQRLQAPNDPILAVFDHGRQTFRKDLYPLYKANRAETPPELIPQFPLVREACQAFGLPIIEKPGYEADDLLAAYAKEAQKKGLKAVIYSSDKDLMQLVNGHVHLFDPIKRTPIKQEEVLTKFGVTPDKVADVLALMGDSSDNIPGVPGIGPKTAAELIQTYGSLEGVLANTASIKQAKRRQMLEENADLARLCLQLVTLAHDFDLPFALDNVKPTSYDISKLKEFFDKTGFQSIKTRLGLSNSNTQVIPESSKRPDFERVTTVEQLEVWQKEIEETGIVAIDTECTSLNLQDGQLVGISLAVKVNSTIKACYIPLAHQTDSIQFPLGDVIEWLKPLCSDPSIVKLGHNLKYDMGLLEKYGVTFESYHDTMILSYVLDGGKHRHNMDALSSLHLGHQTISYKEISQNNKKRFDEVDLESATQYAAEDAWVTFRLYEFLRDRLVQERRMVLYERVERPLPTVVQAMETRGVKVDAYKLSQIGHKCLEQQALLEEKIYKEAGATFNLASPKQLGEILFDKLSYPKPKKTKTGSYTTDSDVLEDLAYNGYPLAQWVLDWRSYAKLYSTYVEGLQNAISPLTGRIHTSFSLAGTATGRLSSSEPNLQNIPIKTELGKEIRSAFIAEEGCSIVSFDYSQIELRLLAHLANVPSLEQAFREGQDIHAQTAREIFGKKEVTSDERRQAKIINFGILYGMSSYGLSKQMMIPTGVASRLIETYFARYPGIQEYIERCQNMARDLGYVETLMGRRCYTPGIHDRNAMQRKFAERQAMNAPLQGSNADIIKKAMIQIHQVVPSKEVRMVLQVHDELVFEIKDASVDEWVPKIKKMMEGIVTLKVPLVVGVEIGKNWG